MSGPIDADQLRALAAVLDEGSFDAAARALHLTPSAVSQRVKALEQRVGRVLVLRVRPCRPTPAGVVLARLAGQVDLLQRDALAAVLAEGERQRLAVAVNADSLSTWFPAALVDLPDGVLVDLRREDQDLSAQLLRDGVVTAAVTADGHAVQGCRVRPLGAMRYLAVAAPAVRDRWWARTSTTRGGWPESAPMVAFNREDALQHRFARSVAGREVDPPAHYVPSSAAFLEVLRAGLGWGMAGEQAVGPLLASGALVDVAPGAFLDVPLYWQHWSLRTPTLDDLTSRVTNAAAAALRAF